MQNTNTSGYSVITAVMLIGFLLVITTNSFYFALQELKDSRGSQNHIQAYSASEGALELALYQIKEHGIGTHVESRSDKTVYSGSTIMPVGEYSIFSKSNAYSEMIQPYTSKVFPLFWKDETGKLHSLSEIDFTAGSDVRWNIIGNVTGASGKGSFGPSTAVTVKEILGDHTSEIRFTLNNTSIQQIFKSEHGNEIYLIAYNASSIDANIELSTKKGEYFSLPNGVIISSAKVGNYKQNIQTKIDNTAFLGTLKYAVISD